MHFYQCGSSSLTLGCVSQAEVVLLLDFFVNVRWDAAKHSQHMGLHSTQVTILPQILTPRMWENSFTPAFLQLHCTYKSPGILIQGKFRLNVSWALRRCIANKILSTVKLQALVCHHTLSNKALVLCYIQLQECFTVFSPKSVFLGCTPGNTWDLSFLTRDQTLIPCIRRAEF